ncbi:F-box protein [Gossypium australe]|uniref:F-box protein n=1 Tax=Gossypium australe TaxID=47621 RepID=A0A5B6VG57_9ROSI|nr:F-box protein [Gossypium australe]
MPPTPTPHRYANCPIQPDVTIAPRTLKQLLFHNLESLVVAIVNGIIPFSSSISSGFRMAEQVKMEEVDRISDLHDSILTHILSFLSTKEAIKTSVLSTRWRYLFDLLPNIDFDLEEDLCRKNIKSYSTDVIENYMCSVDRMLLFCNTTNVSKFGFKCWIKMIGSNRFNGWISAAVDRGVKHLDLSTSVLPSSTLPIFTCKTLVSLKLGKYFVLNVPKDVHLPNLKTLHLHSVGFLNDDSVKGLFSGCPHLEDMVTRKCDLGNIRNFHISHHLLKTLTIRYSYNSYQCWLWINAPNLTSLEFYDRLVAGYSMENLQSLTKAVINISACKTLRADATTIFKGICDVPSLVLSDNSLELLLRCEPLPVFANLIKLDLPCHLRFRYSNPLQKGLETLLSSLPALEKLEFYQFIAGLNISLDTLLDVLFTCRTLTELFLNQLGMAKQVKMENVDRISGFHDSILIHILSFLSAKQVIRTSILSTRWRYLFALLPNLHFDFEGDLWRRGYTSYRHIDIYSYACLVDKMLITHNMTNIDKFRLKCRTMIDPDRFHAWISAAVHRGVKHLDLNISPGKFTTRPAVLFTCRTLVALKLCMEFDFVLDVPKGAHFPNLKTIHLEEVNFSNDDSVKSLLSGCTSLEDLVIEKFLMSNISNFSISHHLLKRLTLLYTYQSDYGWITIDAPNLVYLEYDDELVAGYSMQNLQSLVKADIDISNSLEVDGSTFFGGICNVRSLILSDTSLEIHCSNDLRPYYDQWEKGLETLLSSLPELEKLEFNQEALISLPEKVPSCLLSKLKSIKISDFTDERDCIGKAKYFLKNGRALEKFTIRTALRYSEDRKSKISKVLSASPWESKHLLMEDSKINGSTECHKLEMMQLEVLVVRKQTDF